MLTRLIRGARALFERALRERATPVQTGLSIAVGVFCAFTPFLGFHIWMALGLATLFRLNRLWAALGSRATTIPPMFPLGVFAEVQLSHRLRTGEWVPLNLHGIVAHRSELLLDWLLGTPIVAGTAAVALGTTAYALARRRLRRPEAALTPRTP